MDANIKKRIKDTKVKDQKRKKEEERTSLERNDKRLKGQRLLDNRRGTKRESLPSMEKNEKKNVKRKSKIEGPSYEIVNEEMKDVKLPKKKRQKKEKKDKETAFEKADKEQPGCSGQLEIGYHVKKKTEPSIVILDLETTGLICGGIIPHITQIAAMEFSSKKRFSKYICPELPISPHAQMLTGISWTGETLLYRGYPVKFVGIKTALKDFMTWLQKFPDVTIVAHNGRGFDFRVLSTAVHNCRLSDIFNSSLTGFCDSLDIFRNKYPQLKKHNQAFLAHHFGAGLHNAHNAVDDVETLYRILENACVTISDFMEHADDVECWQNENM